MGSMRFPGKAPLRSRSYSPPLPSVGQHRHALVHPGRCADVAPQLLDMLFQHDVQALRLDDDVRFPSQVPDGVEVGGAEQGVIGSASGFIAVDLMADDPDGRSQRRLRVWNLCQAPGPGLHGLDLLGDALSGRRAVAGHRQSWAAGMGTRGWMPRTPEATTLAVPSHRDTAPRASSTWLPNCLRLRWKTWGHRMS